MMEVATAIVEARKKRLPRRHRINDPLARLHSHRQIDEAQYQGGRAFQNDWKKAERGAQRRGLRTQRWADYFARRLRECLERLALIYGFATEKR